MGHVVFIEVERSWKIGTDILILGRYVFRSRFQEAFDGNDCRFFFWAKGGRIVNITIRLSRLCHLFFIFRFSGLFLLSFLIFFFYFCYFAFRFFPSLFFFVFHFFCPISRLLYFQSLDFYFFISISWFFFTSPVFFFVFCFFFLPPACQMKVVRF